MTLRNVWRFKIHKLTDEGHGAVLVSAHKEQGEVVGELAWQINVRARLFQHFGRTLGRQDVHGDPEPVH